MELYINPCIYSSFIFWINVFVGIYYQEYIYASLFVALFITSILFHSNLNNTLFLILDLLIVFSIFIYGGYSYYTNSYCYDVNKQIGNLYHSLLHIVSSLGHILVVLL
jgi:hypothetical protein